MTSAADDQMLRLSAVLAIVPLSKPTIYRMIKSGEFPRQRKVHTAAVWSKAEVSAWVAEKFAA